MTPLAKMEGFSYSVTAHRSRFDENVTVRLEAKSPYSQAMFFLARDEARQLAHSLLLEAQWLERISEKS